MKYYTMGFSLLLFSFVAILILLYFGGLTRQIEKDIIIIRSEINKLNDKIQINELEYVAHTSPSYLKKLEQFYLVNQYDKNVNLNIVSIQDFKAKSIHKVFKVKK
tara:strand:+ start:198 stop:512 length:315 start_codon:yes stop_codon:yes gene_type:complete